MNGVILGLSSIFNLLMQECSASDLEGRKKKGTRRAERPKSSDGLGQVQGTKLLSRMSAQFDSRYFDLLASVSTWLEVKFLSPSLSAFTIPVRGIVANTSGRATAVAIQDGGDFAINAALILCTLAHAASGLS